MKNITLENFDFYLVTDSALSRRGTLSDVANAIDAGCRVVQYREKSASTRAMIDEAREIMSICRGRALLLINDRVDVAMASNADGVHLGADDFPYDEARKLLGYDKIIGITVHDVQAALQAERLGADYVGASPVFTTSTKKDAGIARGTGMVAAIRAAITIPIVAIGGITKANAAEVINAGADSISAISAVVCAEDVAREVRQFRDIIFEARATRG